MAAAEGVETTARALGVDRDRLARRVSERRSTATTLRRVASATSSSSPTFLELPRPQSPLVGQSVVRLLGRDGEQMEIMGSFDALALVREFWNRTR